MKKVLLYVSSGLLLLCSILMIINNSAESVMLMTSSAFLSFVLAVVLAALDRRCIWLLPCVVFVIITHALYLFASTTIAPYMVYVMGIGLFVVLAALYLAWTKQTSARLMIALGVLMKVCLLPEVVLNGMMFAASAQSSFLLFSLLLTMVSSAYVIAGIFRERRLGVITSKQTPLLCLLECLPIADFIAAIYAYMKIRKWKPAVLPKTPAFGSSGIYAKTPRTKKAVKPNLYKTEDHQE